MNYINLTKTFNHKTKQIVHITCSQIEKYYEEHGGIYWVNMDGTCSLTIYTKAFTKAYFMLLFSVTQYIRSEKSVYMCAYVSVCVCVYLCMYVSI